MQYFETRALPVEKFIIPGTNTVFLRFHRGNPKNSDPNRKKSGRLYKSQGGAPNPDGILFNRHEVPYASTKEAITAYDRKMTLSVITDAEENQNHGNALNEFYMTNNIQEGDEFWVPLPKQTLDLGPALNQKFNENSLKNEKEDEKPDNQIPLPVIIIEELEEVLPWAAAVAI